jgi:hypothetical protein
MLKKHDSNSSVLDLEISVSEIQRRKTFYKFQLLMFADVELEFEHSFTVAVSSVQNIAQNHILLPQNKYLFSVNTIIFEHKT